MSWWTTVLKTIMVDRGANHVGGCFPRLTQLSYSNLHSPKQGIATTLFKLKTVSWKQTENEEERKENSWMRWFCEWWSKYWEDAAFYSGGPQTSIQKSKEVHGAWGAELSSTSWKNVRIGPIIKITFFFA